MKHLRQYIRQILLAEAMKTPADLPDDIVVVINADSKAASIYYGMANNPSEYASLDRSTMGAIDIYSLKGHPSYGNCDDAWMVGGSGAQEGFGPLLYDIAMEWATANGGGLIADRSTVSDEARAVWDYYLNNRSDIEIVQLDDPNNELTDVEEDNCDQEIAGGQNYLYPKPPERVDPDWPKSALSKMYRKTSDSMTKELKALGKLV